MKYEETRKHDLLSKGKITGAGKMTQKLKAETALAEDQNLVPPN